MYTIQQFHEIISKEKRIPDVENVTLKLYTEYFETYIEPSTFQIELNDGSVFNLRVKANQVGHIMGLQSFFDSNHKLLRFPGTLTKIDGYQNLKKGKISFKELKESKKGRQWQNENNKYRVLCFPFIQEAFLKGAWYKFDIDKYEGETKVNPKYIVAYRLENIWLNFCIDIEDEKSNYYCVSNLIAHKKNNRVKNQDLLNVERVVQYKNEKIQAIVCHNLLYKNQLLNGGKNITKDKIDARKHKKIFKDNRKMNSYIVDDGIYEVVHFKSEVLR